MFLWPNQSRFLLRFLGFFGFFFLFWEAGQIEGRPRKYSQVYCECESFICFWTHAVKEGGWTSDVYQNVTLPRKGGSDI